jgi:hypothetical protein
VSRWKQQTLAGGPDAPLERRGNCLAACIASILDISIDTVVLPHGEGWFDRVNAVLGGFGYCVGCLDLTLAPPAGYWIATLPSLNRIAAEGEQPICHCVVARGYALVHDPSKAKRYDGERWARAWGAEEVVEGWALVPLDPSWLVVSA